ncbi:MAG: type II toxin-antitoxin system antitoxin [Pirellulales bacterium]
MKSRKPFLLRIAPDLYDALEAWAQQELRSVNGQIEYLLKEAVAKRRRPASGQEPRPPEEPEPPREA